MVYFEGEKTPKRAFVVLKGTVLLYSKRKSTLIIKDKEQSYQRGFTLVSMSHQFQGESKGEISVATGNKEATGNIKGNFEPPKKSVTRLEGASRRFSANLSLNQQANGDTTGTLGFGQYFGFQEIGLFSFFPQYVPRRHTVVTQSAAELLTIPLEIYEKISKFVKEKKESSKLKIVEKYFGVADVTSSTRRKLFLDSFKHQRILKGNSICREGDKSDCFFVLLSGKTQTSKVFDFERWKELKDKPEGPLNDELDSHDWKYYSKVKYQSISMPSFPEGFKCKRELAISKGEPGSIGNEHAIDCPEEKLLNTPFQVKSVQSSSWVISSQAEVFVVKREHFAKYFPFGVKRNIARRIQREREQKIEAFAKEAMSFLSKLEDQLTRCCVLGFQGSLLSSGALSTISLLDERLRTLRTEPEPFAEKQASEQEMVEINPRNAWLNSISGFKGKTGINSSYHQAKTDILTAALDHNFQTNKKQINLNKKWKEINKKVVVESENLFATSPSITTAKILEVRKKRESLPQKHQNFLKSTEICESFKVGLAKLRKQKSFLKESTCVIQKRSTCFSASPLKRNRSALSFNTEQTRPVRTESSYSPTLRKNCILVKTMATTLTSSFTVPAKKPQRSVSALNLFRTKGIKQY